MPLRSKLILFAVVMLLLVLGLTAGAYLSLSAAAHEAEQAREALKKVTLLEELESACAALGDTPDPLGCDVARRRLLELRDREWSGGGSALLDRILKLAGTLQTGDGAARMLELRTSVAVLKDEAFREVKAELRSAHEPTHRRAVRLLIASCLAALGGAATFAWLYGRMVRDRKELVDRVSRSEKLAALGTLAAGVAHEINNPLTTISMSAEALSEQLPDDLVGYAQAIVEETARCRDIIDDLSDLARGGSLDREPVDPEALSEDALRIVQMNPSLPDVRVEADVPGGLPLVSADRGKLLQVLVNLLQNGIEATGSGGHVTVAARLKDGHLSFRVTDDGRGIPSHLRSRIFEPFFSDKDQGVGLGLALCHRIAELHGGELRVSSPGPGKGSSFTFLIPVEPVDDGA